MRLCSLSLHNIRSYEDATFSFPEGIVLLSGDIGAGKSTVLLGIEFALFGIQRSELSGTGLLRNGAIKGSCALTFEIDGTTYTITRTLKRGKTSVEQESGSIESNGVRTEGTAIELKSKIIDLLGYPPEMLTKAKNHIFRYTLYTPQEDMKNILADSPEDRLALLRKVFAIDKYQRIADNANTYAKALRERKRATDLILIDLSEKKKQHQTLLDEITVSKKTLSGIEPTINDTRARLATTKTQLHTLELQRVEHEQKQRALASNQALLTSKQTHSVQLTKDLALLAQQVGTEPPTAPDLSYLHLEKNKLATKKTEHELAIRTALIKISESTTLKNQSTQLASRIKSLANCPTCLQQVTDTHKNTIYTHETHKITTLDSDAQIHQQHAKTAEEQLKLTEKAMLDIATKEKEAAVASLARTHYQAMIARKTALETQLTNTNTDIQKITGTIASVQEELKKLPAPIAITALRSEYDALAAKERELSIAHGSLTQRIETLTKTLTLLSTDIERKEAAKKKLEQTQLVHSYLTDAFIPLMSHIEKHVLGKIHHEFNALFSDWFSLLASDLMTAKLDETFTPRIQQNGYDTDVAHLSGGERTACALAYRLALNKTINSLINTIKTKDLLILDEPTDGFSTEQLDRMREVLAQTNLKQIIIVSHEQKIEGFADHVIRIHKNEHASLIS